MKLRHCLLLPLLLLPACGSHALAGSWNQETVDGKPGLSLTFEAKEGGSKLLVHTAPDANGSHQHLDGTYTFDAATGAMTVEAALLGKDQPTKWTGKLDDGHLELGAADTRLEFHRGDSSHGH